MNEIAEAFTELERGVQAALETYSNPTVEATLGFLRAFLLGISP